MSDNVSYLNTQKELDIFFETITPLLKQEVVEYMF